MVSGDNSWFQVNPWISVAESAPFASAAADRLIPMPGLTFSAWMSGSEMATSDDLFMRFWDEFKLPEYFGWNYAALSDCLRDLNWISADQYTLFVDDFPHVLLGEPESLGVFVRALVAAGERWSYVRNERIQDRARFQVLFGSGEEPVAQVAAKVVAVLES